MSTESVLAAIDGALSDLEVSGDAMRWTPQPPPGKAQPTGLLMTGGVVYWRPAVSDGYDLASAFRYMAANYAASFDRLAEPLRRFGEAVSAAHNALVPALEEIREVLVELEPSPPPRTDVRAHALWQAQHRNTGPRRPSVGQAKRPRRR